MTNSNRINVPLIAKNIEDAHKKLASKELDPFFTRDVTEQIHQCLEDQIARIRHTSKVVPRACRGLFRAVSEIHGPHLHGVQSLPRFADGQGIHADIDIGCNLQRFACSTLRHAGNVLIVH